MKKREASEHSRVEAWMRHHLKQNPHIALKVELKHTRDTLSLPYAALEPHQLDYLLSFANSEPFVYKFDDTGYRQKPCDLIGVTGGLSLVAIRYPSSLPLLSVFVWQEEQRTSKRKSLTEERARVLAYDVIEV